MIATYIENLWLILMELAPWLLLGTLVAGMLHIWIPPALIKRHLGQRGIGGVLKAALAGVPMPLCSCGVIPAGIGLHQQGASRGASVSFLVATPQTAVDSTLVSYSFFGWPFALFKLVSSFLTGILAGWMADRVDHQPPADPTPAPAPNTNPAADHDADAAWRAQYSTWPARLRGIWTFGIDRLLRMVYGWVVLGVIVSAGLTTFIPQDYFSSLPYASGFPGLLIALLISLPMYACSTASIPIAAGLVHAGLPPGAALVYLVAGPATNVATIGAIYRVFGGRIIAVYLGVIITSSLLFGALFNAVVSHDALRLHSHAGHDHSSPVAALSAVALLILFAGFALRDLRQRRTTTSA
jgi:uncharacterized protein